MISSATDADFLMRNAGIYIHIPFCSSKCDYCSFYSIVPASERIIPLYVESLLREIDYYAAKYPSLCADTLYFGGGTPGIIGGDNFRKILSHLSSSFNFSGVKEITVETNPFSTPDTFYETAVECGVTRLTVGVQSLSEAPARFLGRKRGEEKRLREVFAYPFAHRCADYICGIPGQREADVVMELSFLSSLGLDHISAYLLTIEEGTPLARRFAPDDAFDDLQIRIYSAAMAALESQGFEHYEISNFARNGAYSRHNLKYWEYEPYLGFGPGAHSFFRNSRWANPSDVEKYLRGEYAPVADVRGEPEAMAEFMMMGLRLRKGVSLYHFRETFGQDMPANAQAAIKAGIAAEDLFKENNILRINWEKYFISDSIIGRIAGSFL